MILQVFGYWAFAVVTSKKDKDAIGFLRYSKLLVVPGQFAIDNHAPRCLTVLCSRSPGLVALCQCLAFSYFHLGSKARDNM